MNDDGFQVQTPEGFRYRCCGVLRSGAQHDAHLATCPDANDEPED